MKTSLKKLTSVFLAVLMLLSVFSVVGVAAADTSKASTGASTFKFTDNQGWGSVYVYCWDESGTGIGGEWPGVPGRDAEVNGYGETFFTIDVPDGAVGCVVNNGNGAQTSDITDFSAEGYYTDGTKNDLGHFIAIPWPGEGGGDDPYSGGGDDPYSGGGSGSGYTVVLDASNAGVDAVEWKAWTWADGSEGHWAEAHGTNNSDITFDSLEKNIIFAYFSWGTGTPDQNWSGKIAQSDNMTVDGSTFTVTNANGTVQGSWSGSPSGGGGGGDDPYYPTDSPDPGGSYTVSVNPGEYAADGDWYAYSWTTGGLGGSWTSGTESGGVYTFSGVAENVIFASASGYPETDWGNCVAQTGDLYAQDGATYVISSKRDPIGEQGEMRSIYEGEWGSSPEPDTQAPDPTQAPEPDTQAPDPTQAPEPDTQAPQPTQAPEPTTAAPQPTQAPEPATQPGQTGLSLTTALNGATINTQNVTGTSVTITYNLTSPLFLEDGQGTLYYDQTKLSLKSVTLPNIQSGLILNPNIQGEARFNFTGVNPVSNSGIFDFKSNKVLVTATFDVVGAGATTVNLDMEELDALENGQQVAYYTNKVASAAAASVTQSLANPTVEVKGGEQPTTATPEPGTQAPQPTTVAPQPTQAPQPTTVAPVTQPTTDTPVPAANIKLSATSKKIAAGKTFKLTVVGTSAKAAFASSKKKVASVKANGNVQATVTGLKKGTSVITVKVAGKTLTCKVTVKSSPKIKVNGKKFKAKKTYTIKKGKTIKVKITGKAKAIKNTYKSTKKKVAKVTSKKTKTTVKIRGLKKGKATIKIKVNKVKTFKIKVKVK